MNLPASYSLAQLKSAWGAGYHHATKNRPFSTIGPLGECSFLSFAAAELLDLLGDQSGSKQAYEHAWSLFGIGDAALDSISPDHHFQHPSGTGSIDENQCLEILGDFKTWCSTGGGLQFPETRGPVDYNIICVLFSLKRLLPTVDGMIRDIREQGPIAAREKWDCLK